jgi:hypothetical protein
LVFSILLRKRVELPSNRPQLGGGYLAVQLGENRPDFLVRRYLNVALLPMLVSAWCSPLCDRPTLMIARRMRGDALKKNACS